MKKTYFAPESISLEMNAEQMIATSGASIGISDKNVDINSSMSNKKDMWGKSNMWE